MQAYRSVDRPVTFAQVALSLGNRRLRVYFLSRILAGPKGSDRRSIRATCANSRLVGNPSLGITAGLLVTRPESGMADSGHERYPTSRLNFKLKSACKTVLGSMPLIAAQLLIEKVRRRCVSRKPASVQQENVDLVR